MSFIQVFEELPASFEPRAEIAACYVEWLGALLLLQLAPIKEEPLRWGVPAGKLEIGESPLQAAKRELFEETGITAELSQFKPLGALYVRKPAIDYTYHFFRVELDHQPPIHLSAEHRDYRWTKGKELEAIPLMAGAKEALAIYHFRLRSL